MSLPKLESPVFTTQLPSTGNDIRFRPFTVKEEKLFLMAKDSNDENFAANTIKQVLSNCIMDEININDLASFDIEYLFLQLRSKSVNNIIDISFKDDSGEKQTATINLDDVEVVFDEEHKSKIQLNENVMITMKYPTYEMLSELQNEDANIENIIASSIDKVIVGEDQVMKISDHTKEEVSEFISSFTSKNRQDIEKFFQTMPKLKMEIPYTDSKTGEEKTVELEGLQSFFT